MGDKIYRTIGNFIFCLSMVIFSIFTIYLVFMGSFYWEGGNTAYSLMNIPARGVCMLLAVLLLLLLFGMIIKLLGKLDDKKLWRLSLVCGIIMFVLQIVFVVAARTGIRYDSLKVFDEALALFSQPGIQPEDLNGYFARYSNNYAMTIMTHWIVKILRAVGLICADFSNAVLVLQIVNVLFVDAAFVGVWVMCKKYMGVKAATVFVLYMACNPLSYVWMPFYYTNTCSMVFAVWGVLLLFWGLEKKKYWMCVISGMLFMIGYELRATVAIALLAALIVIFCFPHEFIKRETHTWKTLVIVFLCVLLAMGGTGLIYGQVEKHYLTFDETDTEFPMTHWIAMGLSDTGTFSPADEAYTMSFPTKEEKQEATVALIKERVSNLGITGIVKLYARKLSLTFGDGAGGYHSELNISKHYDTLWQVVYGVYRDPLLTYTQVFYLLSLVAGLLVVWLLYKRSISYKLFFFPLLLVGSYLFQMLWEAGTIYSIGTMYASGVMVAVGLCALFEKEWSQLEKKQFWSIYKKTILAAMALVSVIGVGMLIKSFFTTKYVQVSMSVDQFLFQANEYISLSKGKEISQTFTTDKEFETIALQVSNPEGEFNDSLYLVTLYDGQGNLVSMQALRGCDTKNYEFYPMAFASVPGISDYEIRIHKESGQNELIFLYYDTGHYDVYPQGKMTGLTQGDMADLNFRVYSREE